MAGTTAAALRGKGQQLLSAPTEVLGTSIGVVRAAAAVQDGGPDPCGGGAASQSMSRAPMCMRLLPLLSPAPRVTSTAAEELEDTVCSGEF